MYNFASLFPASFSTFFKSFSAFLISFSADFASLSTLPPTTGSALSAAAADGGAPISAGALAPAASSLLAADASPDLLFSGDLLFPYDLASSKTFLSPALLIPDAASSNLSLAFLVAYSIFYLESSMAPFSSAAFFLISFFKSVAFSLILSTAAFVD